LHQIRDQNVGIFQEMGVFSLLKSKNLLTHHFGLFVMFVNISLLVSRNNLHANYLRVYFVVVRGFVDTKNVSFVLTIVLQVMQKHNIGASQKMILHHMRLREDRR